MNLKLSKKIGFIGFIILLIFLSLIMGWIARSVYYDITWEEVFGDKAQILNEIKEANENELHLYKKVIEYQEGSPDGKNIVTLYKLPYNPSVHIDYYQDYFQNQKIIVVRDLNSQKEYVVFTGEERTNDPHWLGNKHIFFTTYCGTACKGVYLVNTNNKESDFAVWAYIFTKEKNSWETHFKDWFGKKFIIEGLVDSLESEILDGQPYIVFKMKDDKGSSLGEKRFLFTGERLMEIF